MLKIDFSGSNGFDIAISLLIFNKSISKIAKIYNTFGHFLSFRVFWQYFFQDMY